MLAADLIEVARVFAAFFAERSPADWGRRTERHDRGWTLRETVAHLDSVARAYQLAIEAALAGERFRLPGVGARTDLPAWNEREIEARSSLPIDAVCDSFLAALRRASDCAAGLPAEALVHTATFPFYNRPISVGELLGAQAIHPGIIHGAQVANGARVAPLWTRFAPEMQHRQITRLFDMVALAYWPERGGSLRATVALGAGGRGGGRWHVALAPEGCRADEGWIRRPTVRIWFRDADALCRAFTLQLSPVRALLTARAVAWWDLRLAFRLERLFTPT